MRKSRNIPNKQTNVNEILKLRIKQDIASKTAEEVFNVQEKHSFLSIIYIFN